MDARQAQRILSELQRRKDRSTLLDAAFPSQRAFIDDPAREKAALCTRRAGKSYGIGIYLIDEALKTPNCSVLYAALTWKAARNIMVKDVIRPILKERGIKATFSKSDNTFTFSNGSVLYLLGLDASEEEQEKLLGQKYRLAVIDECASFRQDLSAIVGKLRQAVGSYDGAICLIGTPGDVQGYFHKVTTGEVKGWSVHRWTYLDNPYEREQQERVRARAIEADPSYVDTAEYKQFYLGEWAVSESALVYHHDPERNSAQALPEGKQWRYVLGVDLGHSPDPTAYVVLAFSTTSKDLYVVEADVEVQADFTMVAQRVRRLMDAYDPYAVVVDGANKQGVEEMRNRHGIPFEAAEKTAKSDHIRLMNADLRSGRVKVLPMANAIAEEWKELVWDERALRQGVRKEHPKKPNHMSDACLYAWRRCFNYASEPEPERPAPGSEAEVDEFWAREERRVEREASGEWWDPYLEA